MIAAGMSVGKTYMTLSLLERWNARRVLVIAPKAVAPVWASQPKEHGFECRVVDAAHGSTEQRRVRYQRALSTTPEHERLIVVTNYEGFWRPDMLKDLRKMQWDVIVADESHRLKSPFGKAARSVRLLACKRKLALTGTPMPHSPLDIWSQFMWLDPSVLGDSYVLFRSSYAHMRLVNRREIVTGFKNLEDLSTRMRALCVEVSRDVLDLMPVQHITLHIDLSPATKKAYDRLQEQSYTEIEQGFITAKNSNVKTLKLRQLLSGFYTTPKDPRLDDGAKSTVTRVSNEKTDTFIDHIEDIGADEKIVVFANFSEEIESVKEAVLRIGRKVFEQRGCAHQWTDFVADKSGSVLICQVDAAREGIDLTCARYCYWYSLPWSSGTYQQALARLSRTNQTRPVTYYYLQTVGTIEAAMRRCLARGGNLAEAILSAIRRSQGVDTGDDGAEDAAQVEFETAKDHVGQPGEIDR